MPNLRMPTKPRKQTFSRTNGTSTSLSLEDPFWDALTEIAREDGISRTALTRRLDCDRIHANLTSTIRVFVLEHSPSRVVFFSFVSAPGTVAQAIPKELSERAQKLSAVKRYKATLPMECVTD
jgi:predicted DNA-binding ribbon-helix-helix protein